MTIVATIIVLGVLIFVHELGHFLAARSVGVRVERFSIGLGPRVAGFTRGDTEYVLSAIPLGGYVKMGGMDDEVLEAIEGGKEEDGARGEGSEGEPPDEGEAAVSRTAAERSRNPRHDDFDGKPVWARAWVISAGVIMNMIFAFAAYTLVAAGWGTADVDTTRLGHVQVEQLPAGAEALAQIPAGAFLVRIGEREVEHWGEVREAILAAPEGPVQFEFTEPDGEVAAQVSGEADRSAAFAALRPWSEPLLVDVVAGSPAANAELRPGDRVLGVDGREIQSWSEFQAIVQASPQEELRLSLLRDGGELVRSVVPDEVRGQDPVTGEIRSVGQIGVASVGSGVVYTPLPLAEAVLVGWDETVFMTGLIVGFLRDLVTGQVSARNLGSIVAIGEMSGQAAQAGLPVFLGFMAFFSINLAILNLLPIPVLDGGHLVFLTIEAVRGRPLSVEQRLRWSQVGFVVLLGIMALALGNDFLRLFGL